MTTGTSIFRKKSSSECAGDRSASHKRIHGLVARYPDVSGSEAAEILRFMRDAPYAEVARIMTDDSIRHPLDQFIENHKRELHWSASDRVIPIALVIAFIAACWLLWPIVS